MSPPDENGITRTIDLGPGTNGVSRTAPPLPDDSGTTRTIAPPNTDSGLTRTIGADVMAAATDPGRVPGFDIKSELGRGGMGVVYLARQDGLNRDVALKMVLSGGHASATERVRFLAEAEAVASVQHSGIVQVFGYGTHAGQPYFAMEFCPGGSLGAKLDGTPLPAREAAALVAKIARGVQAAHDKNIVHRDLKPSNILIAADGTPKVTDFGLARKSDSGSGLTQTGAILGSPSYMSPEQAEGKHDKVSARSDVYSLGAILYECLTGRPPFRAATPLDTVMQVIKDEPVPPFKLAAKIPRDVDTICLKCLEKDPAKRYDSATALADDLGRYLSGESILARPPNLLEKYWKSVKKRPALNALVLTTCVSIGVAIGVLNGSNRNLRAKQALLEKETQAARAAEAEAGVQRERAGRRLDTALEAVERVMVRVAGEKWARKPELQNERREVLEEAVSFFRGLAADDSQDPNVRRQIARANLFAGTAYITLGEYDKCRESVAAARDLYRGLRQEFPADTSLICGEADSVSLLGHADAIGAQFTSALGHYETVLTLAKEAIAADPAREENQIALVDGYSSLALYYSFQRPDLSKQYHANALAIGEKLLTRPSPGFRTRLGVTTALVNLAVSEINSNRREAELKFDRAEAQIAILDRLSPPNSRAAEMLLSTKAGLDVFRGVALVRRRNVDEGLARMKAGIDSLAAILKVQAKSFPFQVQHIQFQVLYADMLTTAKRTAEATAVMENVRREQEAIARAQPQLTWIRGLGTVQRSNLIIHHLREKFDPDFEERAKQLLDADASATTPAVTYNVACLYAQAAVLGPPTDRERYSAKAMEFLNRLLTTSDYFRVATNVAHLDKDTDLGPLRERADFKAFLTKARAGVKKTTPTPP